ncbi:hypothetical protein BJ322DRAFT_1103317 [Thelephora terrestris]|uniref:DRBM domain-containing protein n=1 Tax=Thelephora terrestris TaxID=56493 RepID=A0A9P6LCL5_9AGAM|nr:hypothetical protein BJ322DRAFT_1103317 [Thelephora terrestris]
MPDRINSNRDQDQHYRTELNNYLQVNGGPSRLQWKDVKDGPQHRPTWTAICYIDGTQYAKVSKNNLSEAKEEAARVAHRALLFDRFRESAGHVIT